MLLQKWNGNTGGPFYDKRVNAKIQVHDVDVLCINYRMCFSDYQKEYITSETACDSCIYRDQWEGLHVITKFNKHQTAIIRADSAISDDISIRRCIHQGCVLSPLLFNLYPEARQELWCSGKCIWPLHGWLRFNSWTGQVKFCMVFPPPPSQKAMANLCAYSAE